MLRPYENCLLYTVTNTNNATWAQNMAAYSVVDLNKQIFTYQSEAQLYEGELPMVVQRTGSTITPGTENKLNIKLKSWWPNYASATSWAMTSKDRYRSPKCSFPISRVQVGHAFTQTTGSYPAADEFTNISGKYTVEEGSTYTWHVPQNLQNTTEITVLENNPQYALYITVSVDSQMDRSSYGYTLYPGRNTINDFYLKNGICYNVVMNLNSEKTYDRVLASPTNRFVTKTGVTLRFAPYEHTETEEG